MPVVQVREVEGRAMSGEQVSGSLTREDLRKCLVPRQGVLGAMDRRVLNSVERILFPKETEMLCQKKIEIPGTEGMANTYCMRRMGHEDSCSEDPNYVAPPAQAKGQEYVKFVPGILGQARDGE